jgi:hypothetical protein
MSGQNWSIVIAPSTPGGPASFTPDLMGVRPGDPLRAGNADIISWNNRTNDFHQLVANGVFLSEVIQPFQSSRPGYVTTAPATGSTTILYTCTFHPDEFGRIVVFDAVFNS